MDENFSQDKHSALPPKKIKQPRLYHKKSRNGCQRCRARRVKCDQGKPECSNCSRHNVSCTYNPVASTAVGSPFHTSDRPNLLQEYALPSLGPNSTFNCVDVLDIPESKSRRMLELRLLQNFITSTSNNFPVTHDAKVREAYSVEVPKLALKHDNLLYEVLALSALHLLRAEPNDPELLAARRMYLGLSLREHRKAVSQLNMDQQCVDATLFASILLLFDAFASLQDRVLDPYSPPLEWLNMARGVGDMFAFILGQIKDYETAKIMVVVNASPDLHHPNVKENPLFSEKNRDAFLGLLSEKIPGDIWDQETRETYENTLSYIGSIFSALRGGEDFLATCRRIMAFPVFIPKQFIDFVKEQRPRALIMLAHFFTAVVSREDVWWIGPTGRREVEGILTKLPVEWRGLAMVGLA